MIRDDIEQRSRLRAKKCHYFIRRQLGRSARSVSLVHCFRNFGDVLHTTVILDHLRNQDKNSKLCWTMAYKYVEIFQQTADFLNVEIIGLPQMNLMSQSFYIERMRASPLKAVYATAPCPFGWDKSISIIDNHIKNSGLIGITNNRPIFMSKQSDGEWADAFCKQNSLNKFIVLEYISYSIRDIAPLEWYQSLIPKIKLPVVFMSGMEDNKLNVGISAQGCTMGQSKELIKRAKLFIGCASGLTCIQTCRDIQTPSVQLNVPEWARTPNVSGVSYINSDKISAVSAFINNI